MSKLTVIARHFGCAMKEIYSNNNQILFYFSVMLAVTISPLLSAAIAITLKITDKQRNIWLLILFIVAILSQYASHLIYHRYLRRVLLARGWHEDSYLHSIMLMAITFGIFTFPAYLAAIFFVSVLN